MSCPPQVISGQKRQTDRLLNSFYVVGVGAGGNDGDSQILDKPSLIMNMSSWATLPLVCPLRMLRRDDLVIWYKDGQPIPSDGEDTTTVQSTNTSALKCCLNTGQFV